GDLEAGELGSVRIDLACAAQRNAELVLGLAGRDLVVGLGVDVGIDPHRHVGEATLAGRDRGKERKLRLRFHIDAEYAFIDRERELTRGLADAGEHDLLGRYAGRPCALEFTLRNDIGAGAERSQRLDHRLVRVRLHGVANQRGHIREGAGKYPVMTLERCGRIAVERGSYRVRGRHGMARLGVHDPVAISEVMRWLLVRGSSWLIGIAMRPIISRCRANSLPQAPRDPILTAAPQSYSTSQSRIVGV